MIGTRLDFGKMRQNEINALKGDIFSGQYDLPCEDTIDVVKSSRGRVFDLVVPIIMLIILCIGSMIYSGYTTGFDHATVEKQSFVKAFSNANSSLALAVGSTLAVLFTAMYYQFRKVMILKT